MQFISFESLKTKYSDKNKVASVLQTPPPNSNCILLRNKEYSNHVTKYPIIANLPGTNMFKAMHIPIFQSHIHTFM